MASDQEQRPTPELSDVKDNQFPICTRHLESVPHAEPVGREARCLACFAEEITAVLVDSETGEWRILQSCADAIEDLSLILTRYDRGATK